MLKNYHHTIRLNFHNTLRRLLLERTNTFVKSSLSLFLFFFFGSCLVTSCNTAATAAFRLDLKTLGWGFTASLGTWGSSLLSQDSLKGKNCWMARFHLLLSLFSSLVITTPPLSLPWGNSAMRLLVLKVMPLLQPLRYSLDHRLHMATLELRRRFSRFLSCYFSSWCCCRSVSTFGLIRINEFGVNMGSCKSSSTYDNGRPFRATCTANITSFSSMKARLLLPIVFVMAAFTRPTTRSNWPPHQGALLRLCFHKIWWWSRKSLSLSSAFTWRIQAATPIKVAPLSEYIVLRRYQAFQT